MNPLHDPLLRCLLMTLWLLPCAIQDWRTRRVSNWLTVPLFMVAWPVALLLGNLTLTTAAFLGTYVAWKAKTGMGAADGKIAVGLAAFAPSALAIGFVLEGGVFLARRWREKPGSSIPGAFWFWIGAWLATVHQVILTLWK
jgi:Flp pilus assembly protein protease CpaA